MEKSERKYGFHVKSLNLSHFSKDPSNIEFLNTLAIAQKVRFLLPFTLAYLLTHGSFCFTKKSSVRLCALDVAVVAIREVYTWQLISAECENESITA